MNLYHIKIGGVYNNYLKVPADLFLLTSCMSNGKKQTYNNCKMIVYVLLK